MWKQGVQPRLDTQQPVQGALPDDLPSVPGQCLVVAVCTADADMWRRSTGSADFSDMPDSLRSRNGIQSLEARLPARIVDKMVQYIEAVDNVKANAWEEPGYLCEWAVFKGTGAHLPTVLHGDGRQVTPVHFGAEVVVEAGKLAETAARI
jgi:hypothetical protein